MHDTNYTTFALMFSRKHSDSRLVVRVYLLCEPLALWGSGQRVAGAEGPGRPAVLLGPGPHWAGDAHHSQPTPSC